MSAILQEIITLLVGGITQIASGIGGGLSALVKQIFLETTGEGEAAVTSLSTFGGIIVIFGGVVLASIGCLLKKIDKQKALNNIKNKGVKQNGK